MSDEEFESDVDIFSSKPDISSDFTPDFSAEAVFGAFASAWLQERQKQDSMPIKGLVKLAKKGQHLRHRVSAEIQARTSRIEEKFSQAPFVRWVDKMSFVVGVCQLPLMQYVLLRFPAEFPYLWSLGIVPLLIYRYFTYHALKYHYFLLDFCYYAQLLLLYFLFVHSDDALFGMVFLLCNGPLASAIVMWKNSLVFHDWDKIISVIIHFHPALVTYTIRWGNMPNGKPFGQNVGLWSFAGAMALYVFWQLMYLFKTEVVDKKKLDDDPEMMTSLRWLSGKRPHPVYKFLRSKGVNCSPVTMIVCCQLIYTVIVTAPVILLYNVQWLHELYLALIFVACVFNGAEHYFDAFAEQYTKRLGQGRRPKPSSYSTKAWSLLVFGFFAAVVLLVLGLAIEWSIALAKRD